MVLPSKLPTSPPRDTPSLGLVFFLLATVLGPLAAIYLSFRVGMPVLLAAALLAAGFLGPGLGALALSSGRLTLRGPGRALRCARLEVGQALHPAGVPAGGRQDRLDRRGGLVTVRVSAGQRMKRPDLDLVIDLGGALRGLSLQAPGVLRVGPELGDAHFDGAVQIGGDSTQLSALLGARERKLVRSFVRDLGGSLRSGRVRLHLSRRRMILGRDQASRGVDLAVTQVLELVDALLARQRDVPGCLREVAQEDPVQAVAVRAARELIALGGAEAASLARVLLDDPRPEFALMGAQASGQAGAETLRRLLGDAAVDPALRSRALAAMALLRRERTEELQGHLSLQGGAGQLALAQAGELSKTR